MPPSPERQCALVIDGRRIDYLLRRSSRRSIGFTVDGRGLRVAVPRLASQRAIEAALRAHAGWIFAKLDAWQAHVPAPSLAVTDGLVFPLLGSYFSLHLDPARQRGYQCDRLLGRLSLPAGRPPALALQQALQAEARQCFAERLALYAAQLGVELPPLRLSSARTRWGSCSSRGVISLNWRLIHLPLELVDYVVAHELAHLKEMNHSPRFWAVVATLCPDWQARRLALRRQAATLPRFD